MSGSNIEVRVGANTQDLQNGMNRASQVIASSMADIKRQMDGIGAMINTALGMAGGAGIGLLGQKAVSIMSSFEQLEIRLNSVMGSATKGEEAFAWIQQFAKDTPFQVSEVTQSFMLLKNMGLDPMGGAMKAIADQAAKTGGGFETLQRVSLGLGQAWTKGKLQGEEAMQLLEAGVPVWDMLAKILHKTTAQVQKLSEKGSLGRDVIKALIGEMGRAADGAAVAQMQSLNGMWSNFIDNVEGGLNRLRKDGALDPLKGVLSRMNAEFDRLNKNNTLSQWTSSIATQLNAVGEKLMSATQFISEYGDQIKLLAEAYVILKAAQAGSQMIAQLTDEMRARVAAMAVAKEKAAADLTAATATSIAAKQSLLLAEADSIAAQAELRRAAAQAESWQVALRSAQAETDLATRTRLTAQAQTELTAALNTRNAAVARAAATTEALNAANVQATASTAAATTAQIAFERATTLAGLAARGFSAVMAMLGGPIGIAIMALIALVTHWDDVAAAAGNAAAKSRKATEDIKQALNDVDVSRMQKGLKEATDEYNRLKLKRQTSGGNLTIDQQALSQAEDNARGRMLQYQKGLRDVLGAQGKDAYQPILEKYEGESEEGRKRIEERNKSAGSGKPPKLVTDEKEAKRQADAIADRAKARAEAALAVEKSQLSASKSAYEAAFNAKKISLTEYFDARKVIAQRESQLEAADIQAKLAANAAKHKAAKEADDRIKLEAEAAKLHGEAQAQQIAAAGRMASLDAERTAALQKQADALREITAESVRAEALNRTGQARADIDMQVNTGVMSPENGRAANLALIEQDLAAQKAFYAEKRALAEGDPVALARIAAEEQQIERESQNGRLALGREAAQESMQLWNGLGDRMSGLWDKGLQAMMNGTLTWKNAMQAIWTDLSMFFVQKLVLDPLKTYLAGEARQLAIKLGFIKADTAAVTAGEAVKTGATVGGEAARTSATAAGGLARLGLKAMETIKSIMMSAWEAMAGAFAAMCAIPVVGPALAVGAGAAALGLVVGIAGRVKSASGGYSIPRGVNPMTQLHEEEMVLPKPYANVIREMAEGKSGSGGDSSHSSTEPAQQYNITIQAVDAHSVKRLFQDHGSALVSALKAQGRNFAGG